MDNSRQAGERFFSVRLWYDEGMSNRFVLAITGPTGSGKSTVAKKLAKQISQCVNIDVDHVKHFIINGFIYDETPEGVKQWELLGNNLGMLAHSFLDADYNVIINGYLSDPAWRDLQKHVTLTHKVLLLPHIDTSIERDAGRDEDFKMGRTAIQEHYDYFSTDDFYGDFVKIDSTQHSIDDSVSEIAKLVKG